MMKIVTLPLLLLSLVLLGGCASSKSGDVYTRDQARREQTVRMGTVESVREVLMEGTKSPVGTVAGAAVGGIAGSTWVVAEALPSLRSLALWQGAWRVALLKRGRLASRRWKSPSKWMAGSLSPLSRRAIRGSFAW
jgi:hypothetical protein